MNAFYFVGKYGEVGHQEKSAGKSNGKGHAYPVFSTYNKNNKEEKHTNAWFIHESDAIDWTNYMNKKIGDI